MLFPLRLAMGYCAVTALFVLVFGLAWSQPTREGLLLFGWVYVVLSSLLWWIVLRREHARFEAHQALLIQDAIHDTLTRLTNRRAFLRYLEAAMHRAARQQRQLGLAFIDLDRFQQINDLYGHAQGDLLLVAAAQRLTETVRRGDLVARVGGDEFVVLVEPEEHEGCEVLARRLLQAFQQPLLLADQAVTLSLSIGVALFPRHGTTAESLLACADQAMAQVKLQGRHGYAVAGLPAAHRQDGMPARADGEAWHNARDAAAG